MPYFRRRAFRRRYARRSYSRRRPTYRPRRRSFGFRRTNYRTSPRRALSSLTRGKTKYVKKRTPANWVMDHDGATTVLRSLKGLTNEEKGAVRATATVNRAKGAIARAEGRLQRSLHMVQASGVEPRGVRHGPLNPLGNFGGYTFPSDSTRNNYMMDDQDGL